MQFPIDFETFFENKLISILEQQIFDKPLNDFRETNDSNRMIHIQILIASLMMIIIIHNIRTGIA